MGDNVKNKSWLLVLLVLLVPYVTTLAWTGTVSGKEYRRSEGYSGKKIILDRDQSTYLDVEEYLIGIVGRQIPADYEPEALKAQAIIARTYIYKQFGAEMEIAESSLDLDYLEEAQLEKIWGKENFIEYYEKIQKAVNDTAGVVMVYEDELIDPLFHRASVGQTRGGDDRHPYLQAVDSREDLEAPEYLTIETWEKEQFANLINQIPDHVEVSVEQLPDTIQLVERDQAGYTTQIQIGSKIYTGEEVQMALSLSSSGFSLESYDGKIRAICKGIGHGYGLSQYGANKKAADGWTATEILEHFYKNIVLISE